MRVILAALAAGALLAHGELAPGARAQDDADIRSHSWAAWVDRMPPGPQTLHLTGVVELPHAGFEVSLAPSEPQGFNPAILMLDLQVTELGGSHPAAADARGVRYDIDAYRGGYREISILHQGELIARVPIGVTY